MNKDYLEYQYSKSKKLTERAFKLRVGMLMISMLACAGVMVSSAFAWFQSDITRTTVLKSANFSIDFRVTQEENDVNVINITETSGVTGFCKVTVIGENKAQNYYTQAFSGNVQFEIVAAEGSLIEVSPHWGRPEKFNIEPTLFAGTPTFHSRTPEPKPEGDSGGGDGEQDVSQEKKDNVSNNTPTVDATENNAEEVKTPMLSVSPSVNKEQITVTESTAIEKVTSSVIEKTEPTVTPSVPSVSEAPAVSDAPAADSGGASDSGSTPSADTSSGNSSGESSSGSSAASSSDSSGSASSGASASSSGGDSGSSAASSSGGESVSSSGSSGDLGASAPSGGADE